MVYIYSVPIREHNEYVHRERDAEINRRIEEVMMTMRASIRDEVLAELRVGNGPSSVDNVPTSSSIHRPVLDLD
ncbi:hypothetical protein LguiA_002496 [Lonicera macranthoides]